LNRGGVERPLGEYCADTVGLPNLDTVGRPLLSPFLFPDRGEAPLNTDGVGEDICIARTSDGVRKGIRGVSRLRLVVGTNSSFSYCERLDTPDRRGEFVRLCSLRRMGVLIVSSSAGAPSKEPSELRALRSLKTSSSASWWELLSPASSPEMEATGWWWTWEPEELDD
jgi:hypothetical protein